MKSSRRVPSSPLLVPRCWLAVFLGVFACATAADTPGGTDNPRRPDDLTPAERGVLIEEGPEKEAAEVTLPPFPRASDLIPLRADSGDPGYNYYIDVNSVSLSADEILFYTIVIQSSDGASNIIHEGIRCATDEVKSFAYGTRDGRFERVPDAEWLYYYKEGALGYRRDLKETYACSEAGWPVDADTVLERLVMHDPRRLPVRPRPSDAGD